MKDAALDTEYSFVHLFTYNNSQHNSSDKECSLHQSG